MAPGQLRHADHPRAKDSVCSPQHFQAPCPGFGHMEALRSWPKLQVLNFHQVDHSIPWPQDMEVVGLWLQPDPLNRSLYSWGLRSSRVSDPRMLLLGNFPRTAITAFRIPKVGAVHQEGKSVLAFVKIHWTQEILNKTFWFSKLVFLSEHILPGVLLMASKNSILPSVAKI